MDRPAGEKGYEGAARTLATLVSFGAFAASCPFAAWRGTPLGTLAGLTPFVGDVLGVALLAVLVGAVACGLAALARGFQRLPRPAVWTSCGLYAGSCAVLQGVAAAGAGEPGGVAAAMLGTALGAGLLGVVLAWGVVFSAWGFRRALVRVSAACAVAAGTCLLEALGFLPGGPWAFAPLAVAGVAAPAVLAASDGLRSGAPVVDDAASGHLWASMRAMVLTPYLGLFLFFFDLAARTFVFGGHEHIGLWSVGVGGVALVALAAWWPRFSLLSMQRAVLPVVAAVFLVLSSFPVSSGFFGAGYLVSHVLMGMVALMAVAALCAVARAGEFPALFIGSAFAAIVALACLVGAGVSRLPTEGDGLGVPLLVCSVTFFAYALVAPALEGYRAMRDLERLGPGDLAAGVVFGVAARAGAAAPGGAASEAARSIDAACDRLAERCGLSARERELLPYLARGHRPVFVAEQLCISESTARTHVRNIYRKLGVGSGEELIQQVEKAAEG